MIGASENKPFKHKEHICIGILAHVDAGKTTLAESILYLTGSIRKPGRVDHGNAFLDTYELEKARGITIFSKQAQVQLKGVWRDPKTGVETEKRCSITLLDTPGHVDFSAETERTLQVLDTAILIVSGADGVQGHVRTLWKLLKRYRVPVFLFVNKMDQPGTDRDMLLNQLRERLDENCVDFTAEDEAFQDAVAMCSELLMEEYLERGAVTERHIAEAIRERKLFPVFFGSALKMTGVEEFLTGLTRYSIVPEYREAFGARVYKIARDAAGTRLTYLKVTGGSLKVKQNLGEEKVDQIRIYSGSSYQLTDEAPAGSICAVTGLSDTRCGQGIGAEEEGMLPLLIPVLNYRLELPEGSDVHKMLQNMRQLEEEIPELHIIWQEQSGEIHVQVMGEVQVEILRSLIWNRYAAAVEFKEGSIVYKETITSAVEGIGHFEPLRHYAEVHLLLEPGEPGSGLVFHSVCSTDALDRNWQRLILTHLEEKKHVGVLTGSEITDMKITLVAGRAHLKHTEGGDFRQAAYRAVRQGLMRAESVLLEPFYDFVLELPTEYLGRAMNDIRRMHGSFTDQETYGVSSILKGVVPVVTMNGYQTELNAYTRGQGKLSCVFRDYGPCHNAEEVIDRISYCPELDLENPAGSVFCAHGAGYLVEWNRVEEFAHVDAGLKLSGSEKEQDFSGAQAIVGGKGSRSVAGPDVYISQEEIEEIFERTYGARPKDKNPWNRTAPKTVTVKPGEAVYHPKKSLPQEQYLLVDGYNIIFAWEDLRELSLTNVEAARSRLMDILCNYQGYLGYPLIVVFDAYKVKGNPGEVFPYHNIFVVYTKEAETADQYIEKTVHEIGKKYRVTVATSDGLEQLIIWGQGAARMSARELREEIGRVNREQQNAWQAQNPGEKNYPFRSVLK